MFCRNRYNILLLLWQKKNRFEIVIHLTGAIQQSKLIFQSAAFSQQAQNEVCIKHLTMRVISDYKIRAQNCEMISALNIFICSDFQ